MPKTTCWSSKAEAEDAIPLWLRDKGHVSSVSEFVLNSESIGSAVRLRREEAKMSLRSLAKWMGVSHTHLSHLETGLKAWNPARLQNASDILAMTERSKI
tara:strand:- start:4 stop:303 length:300 start_codon:yes stop_codon:yes gene_type:complete